MIVAILGGIVESLRELAPVLQISLRFSVAVLALIFGYAFGRAAGRFVKAGVADMKLNGLVDKHHLDVIAGSFTKYLIYIVSIVIALNQIGLALNVLNSILIILLVVVAVGLLLSIRDFVPNIVAGFYIIAKKKIRVGQQIKVQDVEGVVRSIELVETHIRTKKGHDLVVPNSFFVKNVVSIKPKVKKK